MTAPNMESIVAALLAPGKGILAADESLPTIGKRFAALAIPSTEENRRAYREALFTTPGLSDFISGAILRHLARCNSLAVQGKYSEQAERDTSLHEKHRP